MAIQSLPGESEVHYINTEIPHQQNDYIPSATLTKYRVGHYQYTQNGTHLMSYADRDVDPENPTVWVIPGVIDINVPIPQMDPNENVIESNGIYNLVDNDDDPEIEIEPASSNSTENPNVNRGTLVKAKKTIKTLKLEKQQEKGEEDDDENTRDTRDTPVSLGQIRVNVPFSRNWGNNSWRITYDDTEINGAHPDWTNLTYFPEDYQLNITINVNQEDTIYDLNYPYHIVILMIIMDNYQTDQGGLHDNTYIGCWAYHCNKPMEIVVDNYWRQHHLMDIYYSITLDPNETFKITNRYDVNSQQYFILPYIQNSYINTVEETNHLLLDVNTKDFLNCNQSIRLWLS